MRYGRFHAVLYSPHKLLNRCGPPLHWVVRKYLSRLAQNAHRSLHKDQGPGEFTTWGKTQITGEPCKRGILACL